jgi:hypothetical protein
MNAALVTFLNTICRYSGHSRFKILDSAFNVELCICSTRQYSSVSMDAFRFFLESLCLFRRGIAFKKQMRQGHPDERLKSGYASTDKANIHFYTRSNRCFKNII